MESTRRSFRRQPKIHNHFYEPIHDLNKKKDVMKKKATSVKVSKVVDCLDQANKECLEEDVNQGCMFDSMMDSQKNDSGNLVDSVGREDELKDTGLDNGEGVDVNIGNAESVKFGYVNDDMLKGNGGSHNVKLPTLGNEFVIFDEELINDGSKRWQLTLCGFFVGFKMRIGELRYNVKRMWSRTEPDKLPLWVRYCNPPLETLTVKGISALASKISKPLIMDAKTASMFTQNVGRIGYARVLIEVPAKKRLPDKIDIVYKNAAKEVIGQNTVKVVYDWAPCVCSKCGVFGHNVKMCPMSIVVDNDEQINVARKIQREAQPHEEFTEVVYRTTVNHPWAISGDFNVTLNPNEHSFRSSSVTNDIMEFKECINQVEVEDLSCAGLYFTWTKNLHKVKLGDYLGFLKSWTGLCPALLIIPNGMRPKRKSFKFANYISEKEEFCKIIEDKWKILRVGIFKDLKEELKSIQSVIDVDPQNKCLREKGSAILESYLEAVKYEEKLFQKCKIKWLSYGDKNNSFFYKMLKGRSQRNRIQVIHGSNGQSFPVSPISKYEDAFTTKLSSNEASKMVKPITDNEIKKAMLSNYDNKAPGELNTTIISLIPKISTPLFVIDFRPIAYCNVVYKCISKVVTERIKGCLDKLINKNQSAFIPRRLIQDNILLAQDLMHGYNRSGGPKRVAFKIDMQKAYDTVSWEFMENLLKLFGFHEKMVNWIMLCIKIVKFSININGESCGFFSRGRGLRQGDPMSPYLFTMVMEFFTLVMEKNVRNTPEFNYHFGCKSLKITHICFADDLMVFCHGDPCSVKTVIKDINIILKNFLWSQSDVSKGQAKVAWKAVCKPKSQSGLGLKDLMMWNKTLLVKRIWNIACKKDTLWVKWVHTVKLRGIGNGEDTYMWYDNWSGMGRLIDIITHRDLYNARLNKDSCVANMIGNETWRNAKDWMGSVSILSNIAVRNFRIFRSQKRDCTIVMQLVFDSVKTRLMGLNVKKSTTVENAAAIWETFNKIASNILESSRCDCTHLVVFYSCLAMGGSWIEMMKMGGGWMVLSEGGCSLASDVIPSFSLSY
ncbi:RNA-directed DNA polymerase, eukaryota, reverse transcriptase zinc-binding domain protein [Tanacetum coccineum]